jgi:hypothetical protein
LPYRAVAAYPLAAMTLERTPLAAAAATADRHQPMWPWLLIPLVTLALFFVLFKLKASDTPPANSAHQSEASADSSSSDDAESH